MTRILVTGDVTFDSIIHLEKFPQPRPATVFSRRFHETVGGTAAGKALNLHKLGMDVTLHTLLGDDPPGHIILQRFEEEKLPFVCDPDPQGTQRHVNLIDAEGERISIYVVYQSQEPDLDMPQLETLIEESDYVVLNISNYCRRLIVPAKERGKPIWCDLHDYNGHAAYYNDFIAGADVLTMSDDQIENDYKDVMQRIMDLDKQLVICTRGTQGLLALTADGAWIEQPIVKGYEVVDPNGAGDSLFSGVLYGHAHGYDIRRCLQIGALVSALTVASPELVYPDLSPELVRREFAKHFDRPLDGKGEDDPG